jgi:signal transduction histidine kinase
VKRISTLFIFLWAITITAFAQNNTPTNSLEYALNAATSDTARLSVLLNVPLADTSAQTDQALVLYKKGVDIAQKLGNNKKMAQLLLKIGDFYYHGKNNDQEAFPCYQKALEIAEKTSYYEGCVKACNSISDICEHQGFSDKMCEYGLKAVEFAEKTASPDVPTFMNLIYYYTLDNRFNEAYAVGERLAQHEQKGYFTGRDKLLFYGYFLRVLKKMPDKAASVKVYTDKILAIIDTIDLGDNLTDMDNIAYFCLDINRPDIAIKLANQLLNTKSNYRTQQVKADAYKYLAEAYEMLGNYPLSIQHYKAYTEAQVAFVTTSLTNQSREKVLIIESEKALLIKQNEIDKQKWWVISGFCIAIVFLLGALIAYRFYKREQKIKQELAALNATKDKLFALLSHDLMSPMANFKNILMLTDFGLLSQTEFNALAKDLSIKANNLHSMFENVLHWAITQLHGIKTQLEQTNIAAVVNEQVSLLEPIAKGKQIEIEQLIPNELTIELDKNHLALAVRNLLQNALKFTHPKGKIVVLAQNTEGGKKQLKIVDNGIGMTPDIVEKLFKTNENAHRKGTSAEGGTGLGLILTKELIELNGGRIDVSSEVGKGTQFTLAFA